MKDKSKLITIIVIIACALLTCWFVYREKQQSTSQYTLSIATQDE